MVIAPGRVIARENRTRLMACSGTSFYDRWPIHSPKSLKHPHEANDDLLSDPSKDLKTEEGEDGRDVQSPQEGDKSTEGPQ